MLPVSLLFEIKIEARFELPPNELGIWPVKLLKDNCNERSFGRLPNQAGMSPDRLFFTTTSVSRWEDSGILGILPLR